MSKKIYRAIAIGKPKTDSTETPVLDPETKKQIVDFIRTAKKPGPEYTRLANRPASRFIVAMLIEDTKSTATSADGEEMVLGKSRKKGYPITIFDNEYPLLFALLEQQLNRPQGYTELTPTQRYMKVLIPGLVDDFKTFDHYRETRNSETGLSEDFLIERKNRVSGQMEKVPQIINIETKFWYGDDADNVEIMRENFIKTLKETAKQPEVKGTRNKDNVLEDAEKDAGEEVDENVAAISAQITKEQLESGKK